MSRQINCAEAIAALHEGYPQDSEAEPPCLVVHSFLGAFGADWDRVDALRAIREHPQSLYAVEPGNISWGIRHRFYISRYSERGTHLFFETRDGAFESERQAS